MFCDLDARRLLFATQGKDAAIFEAFAGDLAAPGGDAEAITDVSLDLGAAYQAGARKHCPNAKISFDPFHVVALANGALDQVRRAEVKHEADLKGIRWGTLKDAAKCSRNQINQINQMHWLQQNGACVAAQAGAARGVLPGQRHRAGEGVAGRLAELGSPLSTDAIQAPRRHREKASR